MKKLLRHWIAAPMTALHLTLGGLSSAAWLLGSLIAPRTPDSALCGRLSALGYAGLFLTLLAVLLHAAVHGCNRFLLHYRETSRLPVRQLTLVCLFSALLLLVPGAGLMFLFSLALPRLCRALAALLFSRRQTAAPAASAELLPGVLPESPDLSGFIKSSGTPAWVRAAEQILLLTGTVLLAALILFALYRALTALFYCFAHRAAWDDDIRISLKPGEKEPGDGSAPNMGASVPGRLRRLFSRDPDPRAQIRRRYKKAVLAGLAHTGKNARRAPFPWSWASPEELERLSGAGDTLHLDYEKARYGEGKP